MHSLTGALMTYWLIALQAMHMHVAGFKSMSLLCYQAVAPRLLASTSGIQQVQLPCLKGSLAHATLTLPGSIAGCPISTPCQVQAQQGMPFLFP